MRRSVPWLAVAAAYTLLLAVLTPGRHWDPDEFEHAQAAWMIGQGLIPFVDFFEHHTPLWHLLAAIPASWIRVPVSPDGPLAFLLGARFASLAASSGTAAVTWLLARRLAGPVAATLAAALLASASFFIQTGIEVRPDPFATLGLVITTYALARSAGSAGHRWAFAAGLAYGLSVLASQKTICAAPGLALGFLWLAASRVGTRAAFHRALIAATAALLAILPVLGWFTAHGAIGAFLHHTVTVNLQWTRDQDHVVWQHLWRMMRHDAMFGLLAGLGILGLARHRRTALILAPWPLWRSAPSPFLWSRNSISSWPCLTPRSPPAGARFICTGACHPPRPVAPPPPASPCSWSRPPRATCMAHSIATAPRPAPNWRIC